MKLDDLDRILISEEPIAPSSSFVEGVMSRIQAETAPHSQLPFPWIPFASAALCLAILTGLIFSAHSSLGAMNSLSSAITGWIVRPANVALRNALLSAFASLLGTMLLVRLSLRLTGAKR
jgi:hypothetical protein